MKEPTRHRLTGSLFLLAIAVICLPMLFDGAGVPARALPEMAPDEALREPPEPGVEIAAGAETLRARDEAAEGAELLSRVEKLREQVDEDGFLTRSGTRFGEPVLTAAGRGTDVWAVQVASFREAGNAEALRDRLRDDGFEAFISTVKNGEVVLSRVAVGPLLERDRVERLRDELSSRYGSGARIMAFSN
ncbi:MAG: SPOR domain-containing protein [Pseudomonadota bacterium]